MALYEESFIPGYASFAQLPLMQWGPQNCMDWGCHICQKYSIEKLHIDISSLTQTNGQQLIQSTERDFCLMLGDQYGSIFYKEFEKLKKSMVSKVQMRYSNNDNNTGIEQSQYTDNLDPYSLSLDSYSTNYSYHQDQHGNNTSDQSRMNVYSTNYSYHQDQHGNNTSDQSKMNVYSTNYSYNQDLQGSNTSTSSSMDAYSTSYSYNQNLQDSNTFNSSSLASYSTSYNYNQDLQGNNTSNSLNMEPYSTSYRCQDLKPSNSSNPYIPSISSNSTTYSYSQDLQNSNTSDIPRIDSCSTSYSYPQKQSRNASEFNLDGDLEHFGAECEDILDSYDSAWDIHDDSCSNIDITNTDLDLNLDVLSLENIDVFGSPIQVQQKVNGRQAKQKANQKLNFPDGCVEDSLRKVPGVGNKDRCPKSWEFLMRLLVSTDTNPSLIRWEDESQYTFRLVKPDAIVQIWNNKSEKASPNKDNFARSLRYHYKKGILIPVPEKQFVYRCGPTAIEYIDNLRKL